MKGFTAFCFFAALFATILFAHNKLSYPFFSFTEYLGYRSELLRTNVSSFFRDEPTFEERYPGYDQLLRWTRFNTGNYKKYSNIVSLAAYENNLDPDLLRAVIIVESKFNTGAASHKGASGLMQLMPATAAELGVVNILDPKENVNGGARYLRWLLDMHDGNLELALASYNAGPGAVRRYKGIPPFPETQNYVKKVMEAYKIIQGR